MTTLERLKQLEAKATPGLWAYAIESGDYFLMTADYTNNVGSDEDVEFIAEMRNVLPKLLAVVEAAAELEELYPYVKLRKALAELETV
jgi:hypothetical protein